MVSGEGSKSSSARGRGIERVAVRDKRVTVDTPNVSCCFSVSVYSCTYLLSVFDAILVFSLQKVLVRGSNAILP